jgi:hypothetical protein
MLLAVSIAVALAACGGGGELACADCEIRLEKIGTLGRSDGPGSLNGFAVPALDSQGRVVIVSRDTHDGLPFVLTDEGDFVGVVGQVGEGPGELKSWVTILIGPADSIFAFDMGMGRMSVFAPDLSYARTVRIDGMPPISGHRLASGDWLVASGSDHGWPLRLLGSDARELAAWGDTIDFVMRNGLPARSYWIVGPGRDGTAWAVPHFGRYEARRFDAGGTELNRISPEVEWYAPYRRPPDTSPDTPPFAALDGVWEDGFGLWVVGMTADPEWRSALGAPRKVEGHEIYPIDDPDRGWDGVVELRDPETGELLARRRTDEVLYAPVSGRRGVVFHVRTDDLGFVYLDLYKVNRTEAAKGD